MSARSAPSPRPRGPAGASRRRDDRGMAGGLLTVGVCLVVLVVSVAATTVVAWVAQVRHVQQAAELAALAGATAAVEGRAACDAAEGAARRNDARVAECRVTESGRAVVVQVTAEADLSRNPQIVDRSGDLA